MTLFPPRFGASVTPQSFLAFFTTTWLFAPPRHCPSKDWFGLWVPTPLTEAIPAPQSSWAHLLGVPTVQKVGYPLREFWILLSLPRAGFHFPPGACDRRQSGWGEGQSCCCTPSRKRAKRIIASLTHCQGDLNLIFTLTLQNLGGFCNVNWVFLQLSSLPI